MGSKLSTEEEVRFHLRALTRELERVERETRGGGTPEARRGVQELRARLAELQAASEDVLGSNARLRQELRQLADKMAALEREVEQLAARLEEQERDFQRQQANLQRELNGLSRQVHRSK